MFWFGLSGFSQDSLQQSWGHWQEVSPICSQLCTQLC